MIKVSKCGECWYDTIIICEEKFNDKNYFEKWFKENKLTVEIEEQTNSVNNTNKKYKFYIRWK